LTIRPIRGSFSLVVESALPSPRFGGTIGGSLLVREDTDTVGVGVFVPSSTWEILRVNSEFMGKSLLLRALPLACPASRAFAARSCCFLASFLSPSLNTFLRRLVNNGNSGFMISNLTLVNVLEEVMNVAVLHAASVSGIEQRFLLCNHIHQMVSQYALNAFELRCKVPASALSGYS